VGLGWWVKAGLVWGEALCSRSLLHSSSLHLSKHHLQPQCLSHRPIKDRHIGHGPPHLGLGGSWPAGLEATKTNHCTLGGLQMAGVYSFSHPQSWRPESLRPGSVQGAKGGSFLPYPVSGVVETPWCPLACGYTNSVFTPLSPTRSHYVAQAGLGYTGSSYLCLPSAGIAGMYHHTQLKSSLHKDAHIG
jgi:hypothetical protein